MWFFGSFFPSPPRSANSASHGWTAPESHRRTWRLWGLQHHSPVQSSNDRVSCRRFSAKDVDAPWFSMIFLQEKDRLKQYPAHFPGDFPSWSIKTNGIAHLLLSVQTMSRPAPVHQVGALMDGQPREVLEGRVAEVEDVTDLVFFWCHLWRNKNSWPDGPNAGEVCLCLYIVDCYLYLHLTLLVRYHYIYDSLYVLLLSVYWT